MTDLTLYLTLSLQGCWSEWKVGGDLGQGPFHFTILSMPPVPTLAPHTVLKISTVSPRNACPAGIPAS